MIRRLALVVAMSVAVVVGSNAAAQAALTEAVPLPSMSISTVTVAAPTQVEAVPTCTTSGNTTTASIKIEWWRSATPGVTGYSITVYPSGQPAYELVRTGNTDQYIQFADQQMLAAQPRFSLTTLTGYGWTAESARTQPVRC